MKHTGVVLLVVALSRAAFAQTAPEPTDPDPTHGPGFVTIDRQDAQSRVGVEASYLFYNTNNSNSVTPLRFNGYGQYVDAASGFGGYASLPISYINVSPPMGMSQSADGLGDLEVGGIWVPHISTPGVGVILHAGVTLPTGSSGKNTGDGAAANILVGLSRLDDYYLVIPKGVSLRLGVSPVFRSGQFFARADFAIDANMSDEDSGMTGGKSADTILRVNLAAGADLGQVAVSAEVTNLYDSSANGTMFGDSWIDTGAVAARFNSGQVQPYAAIVFPLDHDSYTAFGTKFDTAITVGASGAIQ